VGIAKSVAVAEAPKPQEASKPAVENYEYNGVPVDFFRHFDLEMSKSGDRELQKLKDIYSWAKKDTETLGDALVKISRLESQLGSGGFDRRYDKVWNWVRITTQMEDLNNRRESMRKRWL